MSAVATAQPKSAQHVLSIERGNIRAQNRLAALVLESKSSDSDGEDEGDCSLAKTMVRTSGPGGRMGNTEMVRRNSTLVTTTPKSNHARKHSIGTSDHPFALRRHSGDSNHSLRSHVSLGSHYSFDEVPQDMDHSHHVDVQMTGHFDNKAMSPVARTRVSNAPGVQPTPSNDGLNTNITGTGSNGGHNRTLSLQVRTRTMHRKISIGLGYSHQGATTAHMRTPTLGEMPELGSLDDPDISSDEGDVFNAPAAGSGAAAHVVRMQSRKSQRRNSDLKSANTNRMLEFPSFYTNTSSRSLASGEATRVFDPRSSVFLKRYWLVVITLFALYEGVGIPIRIAFGQNGNFFLAIDIVTDIIFLADIFIRLRTGFYVHDTFVANPRRILEHYLRTWLIPDVLAALPIDLFQLVVQSYNPAFRVIKIVRVSLLFRLNHHGGVNATPGVDAPPQIIYILSLFFKISLLCHYVACLKFMINDAEGVLTWSDSVQFDYANADRFRMYLASMQWSISIITSLGTTAVPETFLETAFTVCVMGIGILSFAFVIGKVGAVVDQANLNRKEFRNNVQFVHQFMSDNSIPLDLQNRVSEYYSYLWASVHGFQAQVVIAEVPLALRTDISTCSHSVFKQAPLFRNLELGFVRALANHLRVIVCVPRQWIIRASSKLANKMYFIKDGNVQVVIGNNFQHSVVATLRTGDSFGEYALLGVSKSRTRSASIRSCAYCTLLILEKPILLSAMQRYPRSGDIVMERAHRYYNRSQKKDKQILEDDIAAIFGDKKGWDKLRRYLLLRKVIRWLSPDRITSSSVFHPQSATVTNFRYLTLVFYLYNAIGVPFRCGFTPTAAHPLVLCLDYTGDFILWMSIYISFRTAYVYRGQVIKNRTRIAWHYMESWFFLDLTAVLPLDLAMLAIGMAPALRLGRLLYMIRFDMWARDFIEKSRHFATYTLFRFTFGILLLGHWIACVYWMFTDLDGFGSTTYAEDSWLPTLPLASANIMHKYLRAFFFAMSLLTGVSKHPIPEKNLQIVFTCAVMLFGMFCVALLINNMAQMLANMDSFGNDFAKSAGLLQSYVNSEKDVTPGLRERVQQFLNHKWAISHGIDPNKVLVALPKPLRTDLAWFMSGSTLECIPEFSSLGVQFLRDLAYRLVIIPLPPREWVFRRGDPGSEMFIIHEGLVDLYLQHDVGQHKHNDPLMYGAEDEAAAKKTVRSYTLRGLFQKKNSSSRSNSTTRKYEARRPRVLSHDDEAMEDGNSSSEDGDEGGSGEEEEEEERREDKEATQPYKVLGSGSFFGEVTLFTGRRAASARARTPVSLLLLHKVDVLKLFSTYPNFAAILRSIAASRSKHTKWSAQTHGITDFEVPEDVVIARNIEKFEQHLQQQQQQQKAAEVQSPELKKNGERRPSVAIVTTTPEGANALVAGGSSEAIDKVVSPQHRRLARSLDDDELPSKVKSAAPPPPPPPARGLARSLDDDERQTVLLYNQ